MDVLKKRLLSLAWRAGAFVAVGIVAALGEVEVMDALVEDKVPVILISLSALVLAEITKWINKKK